MLADIVDHEEIRQRLVKRKVKQEIVIYLPVTDDKIGGAAPGVPRQV